jgi:hypothetical protein
MCSNKVDEELRIGGFPNLGIVAKRLCKPNCVVKMHFLY